MIVILPRIVSSDKSLMFSPSIRISPPLISYSFAKRLKIVVLPEPLLPTNATVVFASTLKDKSFNTGMLFL